MEKAFGFSENIMVGVDESVNSTISAEKVPLNKQGQPYGPRADYPLEYKLVEVPSNLPTIIHIVNGVVTPTLQVLLYDVLGVIDASIPNKDQNRAVKNIIRNGFDKAYIDILKESYPDTGFQFGSGHALEPSPDKTNAAINANQKM